MATMTKEERNKRQRDSRFNAITNKIRGIQTELLRQYQKAEQEHVSHAELLMRLQRREPYRLPGWADYEILGYGRALFDMLWSKLVFVYRFEGELLPVGHPKYEGRHNEIDTSTGYWAWNVEGYPKFS